MGIDYLVSPSHRLMVYWKYTSTRNSRHKGASVTIEPDREIAGQTDNDTVPLYAAPMKRGRKKLAKDEGEDFFDTEDDK